MLGPGISREPPIEEVTKEETVEESPQPLELEEEAAEVEAEVEVAARAADSEPARPGVYRLFGHELEEVTDAGEVSKLRCVRCGAEAPVTEAAALKERACKPPAPGGGFCRVCGKTGIESGYCDDCARGMEYYALAARPILDYERRPVKVLPPESPKAEGWAWVGNLRTFFPYYARGEGRVWPCPACDMEFRRLADAMEHFAEAHPRKTGGFEEVFDLKSRKTLWRSWQGYVCPRCGALADDLSRHKCGEEG